jgi:hypothetical protein
LFARNRACACHNVAAKAEKYRSEWFPTRSFPHFRQGASTTAGIAAYSVVFLHLGEEAVHPPTAAPSWMGTQVWFNAQLGASTSQYLTQQGNPPQAISLQNKPGEHELSDRHPSPTAPAPSEWSGAQ